MAYPASVSGRERRWHFLVRVTWQGTDYRFSQELVSPSDSSGVVSHVPSLEVGGYSETFQFLSQTVDRQSVPVSVLWPDDVAAAVAAGYRLDTAEGELSVWIEGQRYDQRRVLLVGRVMQPSYGAKGERVSFSIEAPPWNDGGTWPDLFRFERGMTPTTVPTSISPGALSVVEDKRTTGRNAPTVIANPGNLDKVKRTAVASETIGDNIDLWRDSVPGARTGVTIGRTTGSPKQPGLLMLCGHATEAGAFGSTSQNIVSDNTPLVNLYNAEGQWLTCTIPFHTQVGGRTVTACPIFEIVATGLGGTMLTKSLGQASTSDRFGFTFLSGHQDFDTFHGLTNTAQAGPLRTVHDLLVLVLSSSAYPVDWPRLYAALGRVPTFDVEGYLDERVGVWDFVSQQLLPLLPLSVRVGPRGLYAITADFSATVADTIGTLRAGVDCFRSGPVQYERRLRDLTGSIVVEAGNNGGQPASTVEVSPSSMVQGHRARLAQQSSVAGQILSRVQQSPTHQGQTTQTIKAPWLAGQTGAHYVATQRIAFKSAQLRTVRYELRSEFVELEVGDLVRLIDFELAIDGPAYLSTLEIDGSRISGTFTLYDPVQR
jgi:hypothetical protein